MMRIAQVLILALLASGCCRAPQGSSSDERETYLLHEGLHRVARLSLKVVRDTDPADPAVQSLRSEARAHLLVYSQEVEELNGQYNWPILKDKLVGEVRQYLTETESPNQGIQPTK